MATSKSNGLLPVTASQMVPGGPTHSGATKPPPQKLKAIVRRLPPGLTVDEFTTILGNDWKLGQGKVDWFQYKTGKDSRDLSKPSKPSRAYFHMTSQENLLALADLISQTAFEDAENTSTSSCLVGPPVLEIALYGKVPGTRHRVDQRAGTIDQDPEYQWFLEQLTNPAAAKEPSPEVALGGGSGKPEKVTTTPLIQYLREKKVAKVTAAKAARKQESLLTKGKLSKELSGAGAIDETRKKGKDSKSEKSTEKATKQTIKILNREAASKAGSNSNSSAKSSDKSNEKPNEATTLKAAKGPAAQRGAATPGQVRMLQRDLGITPRLSRRELANAQKEERANGQRSEPSPAPSVSSDTPSTIPTAPRAAGTPRNPAARPSRRARGPAVETNKASSSGPSTASPKTPMVLLKKSETAQNSPSTPATPTTPVIPAAGPSEPVKKSQSVPASSNGATQAFVKHANPSQGVTEELLKQALEAFGPVSLVEIDKRKGFAYVNFVDSDSMKKAMAANPITVARGTVQVMQRKATSSEKKPQPQAPPSSERGNRGGRGGRGGAVGRRGGRGGMRGGAASSSDAPGTAPTGPAPK